MSKMNRRTVLTSLPVAAVTVPAANVKAGAVDPIVSLFAENDRLEKIWTDLEDIADCLHSALPDRIKSHPYQGDATAEEVAGAELACGYIEAKAEADKVYDDSAAVAQAACKTVPTKRDGLLAQVDYIKEILVNGTYKDKRELDCVMSIRQAVVRGLV